MLFWKTGPVLFYLKREEYGFLFSEVWLLGVGQSKDGVLTVCRCWLFFDPSFFKKDCFYSNIVFLIIGLVENF